MIAETPDSVIGYAYAGPWRRKPAYRATVEDSIFVAPGRTGLGVPAGRLLPELLSGACSPAREGLPEVIGVIADSPEGKLPRCGCTKPAGSRTRDG